jgi:hypothetical protein
LMPMIFFGPKSVHILMCLRLLAHQTVVTSHTYIELFFQDRKPR